MMSRECTAVFELTITMLWTMLVGLTRRPGRMIEVMLSRNTLGIICRSQVWRPIV